MSMSSYCIIVFGYILLFTGDSNSPLIRDWEWEKKYTYSYLTQLTKRIVLIQNSSKETSMFSLFLVEVYKYSKYQMCILNANTVSYTQVKSHKYKSD